MTATAIHEDRPQTNADASGAKGPDMSRTFESIADGHDYVIQDVDGQLPAQLRGTLYRNGPSRNEIAGTPFAHLFDGDGMLSQFVFADGQVHYRNRFVVTNHYLGEHSATRATLPRIRVPARGRADRQRISHAHRIQPRKHQRRPARRQPAGALGGRPSLACGPRHACHDR